MPTANELILTACQKLGVKESGGTLTASEASDSLSILNSMLDSWSIEGLMIYQTVQSQYSWSAGNTSRTIGTGGNFNGPRPDSIEPGTFFRDQNGIDRPVDILRDRQSYDSYASKTATSTTIPISLFLDPGYPLATLYCYPTPSITLSLFLNYQSSLQNFATVNDSLSLPPGYQWAIEHNLAVALESVFQTAANPSVMKIATESKKIIKRNNHIPITSYTEAADLTSSRGGYNVYADR